MNDGQGDTPEHDDAPRIGESNAERDAPRLSFSPGMDAGQDGQHSANEVDDAIGMEARVMAKGIRVPPDGTLSKEDRATIIRLVREHRKKHGISQADIARQLGCGDTTISEVLGGKYKAANPDALLRKLNAWLDTDERRRRRRRPIGFYPTCVFEVIRAMAQLVKSNARLSDSRRQPVAEHDPARIALAWGPAGCGKSLGAEALSAEDPLSILVRITEKGGTSDGLANLIIDAMGIRSAKRGGAVRFVLETLRDTGRLLIVDEAHRLKFSGTEFIRDLVDVCGIPILMLATSDVYEKITQSRQRRGSFAYDQFSRRVCHVAELTRGMDGKGGVKRPVFSIEEVREMFRGDKVRIARDAYEYLQDVACTVGLGMLGLAAAIFEKAYRAAARSGKAVTGDLLRQAARRVLIPAGGMDEETLLRIDRTGERHRSMAAAG